MANLQKKINPNASKDSVFKADLSDSNVYPHFIEQIKFNGFRHISDLTVKFSRPVTVVSGSNRSGKTTLLLSIACSHFEFNKRNYSNGRLERQTWSDVLKFTAHDKQTSDWTYFLSIKTGAKREERRGQRKHKTKKWNGLGKKESQITGVNVVYLDLDRILPARYYSSALHKKAQTPASSLVSKANQQFIEECLSYIFEEKYSLAKLADHLGKDLLGFSGENEYSSYNSASGEDVLSRILIDCIDAPKNSLILIDEIELGLHPGVQRRLMDMIFEISCRDQKQFIITSHSGTVISSVPENARVFIDSKAGKHSAVSPISLNATLSKMDSKSFPLIDVFCEDPTAEKIIHKALSRLEKRNIPGISGRLVNVIESGSANDTFENFSVRERIYGKVAIRSGHSCVLDGDMRILTGKNKKLKFPIQTGLFFLPGTMPPEHVLCDLYEKSNNNKNFRFHIQNSNVHCLFEKMMEIESLTTKDEAFSACWEESIKDPTFLAEFDQLVDFLVAECRRYSPDL